MKISLITVCYNAEKTIADTIRSVFAQRCSHEIEYLIVEGASKDGTLRVIEELLKGRKAAAGNVAARLISEPDRGMYDAINKGIRLATGDIVGILNADDRFNGETILEQIAQAFAAQTELDCVYGDVRFVRGESPATARYYSSGGWRRWMHNWGYMPAHPTVYVRKGVFDRYGGYKLGYDISADFEWMVRVFCRRRITARYLPLCMVTMRLGGKSTAGLKAMLKLNRENVRANRENGYFCCLPMMGPKYLYKIWGYLIRK